MTARECESGRRAEAAPVEEHGVCGICGGALPSGPKLVIMPEINGQLREARVCPYCFLKVVLEEKP